MACEAMKKLELKRALVGVICLHECHTTEFAGVGCFAHHADSGHQPRAVPDGDCHAERLFQGFDFEPIFERARDRLLGIDVLAGLSDLARERKMLLVRHGEDDPFDLGISKHARKIGRGRDSEFPLEGGPLFLGAAETGDDF